MPLNLKRKIKSFFTIPEEVFVEEPLHPNAEKYKVRTLSKNFIFISILIFLLIVDILVAFDLNKFYIRAILGFLFIVTIPGLLIMLMMKIREVGFWEYLVYTVGLSISFIMFAGLAVNWTLPWLNITDKPLSLWPILISFNIFLLIFWIIAFIRNQDLHKVKFNIPQLDTLNTIFFIIPMLFPVLAILGAFLLNNHGPNWLTMIMLGGIALYVLAIVIFRKRLNPNIYPWALWMIGLSLLMSGWLRGWRVFGIDNSSEDYIFQLVIKEGFWDVSHNFYHYGFMFKTYNAMLSLGILPLISHYFINPSQDFLFKLLFPMLFSVIYLSSYIFYNKIFSRDTSFIATFFLIFLPMLNCGYSIALRQGIALLYFILIIIVFFTKQINSLIKKVLFIIFGASMVVSHYSTTYITLLLLISLYSFRIITKVYKNHKKTNTHYSKKKEFCLSGIALFILLIFGFLWYSQVTPTSDGLVDFIHKSFSNLNNLFEEDVQYGNGGVIQNFLTFRNLKNPQEILDNYLNSINLNASNTYLNANKFSTILMSPYGSKVPNLSDYLLSKIISYFGFLFRITLVLGLFSFLFLNIKRHTLFHKNNPENSPFISISLISASITFLLLLLPFFSLSYGVERAYQQVILILSPFLFFGFLVLFSFIKMYKLKKIIVLITIIFYFLLLQGFILSLFNSPESLMKVDNYGLQYNYYYPQGEDFFSLNWLLCSNKKISISYWGVSLMKNSHLSGELTKDTYIRNCFSPICIFKKDYIVSGKISKLYGINPVSINTNLMSINFPIKFLNSNKNKIYNNGGSEVFR